MAERQYPQARIFPVDTRFQRLARRRGGVARDRAIKQATVEIEKVKLGFDEWLDKELRDLNELFKNADAGAGRPDSIEIAMFLGRELRDVSGTMGFELISFVADSLCAVLEPVIAGGKCNSELIACHIDALGLARQHGYRHVKPEQVPELTNGLYRVAKLASI